MYIFKYIFELIGCFDRFSGRDVEWNGCYLYCYGFWGLCGLVGGFRADYVCFIRGAIRCGRG